MAQRATSLGPKPSLFYLFLFFWCFFVVFFVSLSLLLLEKTLFSPLKRAFLCIFSVCPFVSLLPCFTFSFFFVSLSSSFLFPSFLFLSFLFLVLAFPFCFLCFLLLRCSLVSVVLVLVLFYLQS